LTTNEACFSELENENEPCCLRQHKAFCLTPPKEGSAQLILVTQQIKSLGTSRGIFI
jgi:hypothetical protein